MKFQYPIVIQSDDDADKLLTNIARTMFANMHNAGLEPSNEVAACLGRALRQSFGAYSNGVTLPPMFGDDDA